MTVTAAIEYALKPLIELYPAISIETFGPLMMKNIREKMIQLDWSRKVINKRIGHIRRMSSGQGPNKLSRLSEHNTLEGNNEVY
jgi:hypothetical protein